MMNLCRTGGSVPGLPTRRPVRPSDLVSAGSSLVPMAMRPPGLSDIQGGAAGVQRLHGGGDPFPGDLAADLDLAAGKHLDLVPYLQGALGEGPAENSALQRVGRWSRGC